jgi:hypothetical protein
MLGGEGSKPGLLKSASSRRSECAGRGYELKGCFHLGTFHDKRKVMDSKSSPVPAQNGGQYNPAGLVRPGLGSVVVSEH